MLHIPIPTARTTFLHDAKHSSSGVNETSGVHWLTDELCSNIAKGIIHRKEGSSSYHSNDFHRCFDLSFSIQYLTYTRPVADQLRSNTSNG